MTPWYKEKGLKLYGYFQLSETSSLAPFFVFGQTILRGEIQKPTAGVFTQLFESGKIYGSSKKFMGLKDIAGNTILQNTYEEISSFEDHQEEKFLLIKSHGLYGLAMYDSPCTIILPAKYERIFYAGEYTLGIVQNKKVGFADTTGRVVVNPIFTDFDGYNIFKDGKALVTLAETIDPYTKCYCDHYGNQVVVESEYIEDYPDSQYLEMLKSLRRDQLDAYEGEESNKWNTY